MLQIMYAILTLCMDSLTLSMHKCMRNEEEKFPSYSDWRPEMLMV